jgi:hypothetical protein
MRSIGMPTTLRFTKQEEVELQRKCVELNKLLIMKERPPIRESELAHIILKEKIKDVKVDKDGNIYIE